MYMTISASTLTPVAAPYTPAGAILTYQAGRVASHTLPAMEQSSQCVAASMASISPVAAGSSQGIGSIWHHFSSQALK